MRKYCPFEFWTQEKQRRTRKEKINLAKINRCIVILCSFRMEKLQQNFKLYAIFFYYSYLLFVYSLFLFHLLRWIEIIFFSWYLELIWMFDMKLYQRLKSITQIQTTIINVKNNKMLSCIILVSLLAIFLVISINLCHIFNSNSVEWFFVFK